MCTVNTIMTSHSAKDFLIYIYMAHTSDVADINVALRLPKANKL